METVLKALLILPLNIGLLFGAMEAIDSVKMYQATERVNRIQQGKELRQHCKELILSDALILKDDKKAQRAKAICHSELTY